MSQYRFRYFFDAGSGTCLWSANEAAKQRFGYPVESNSLPLPENIGRRLVYLTAWYDTSIDWNYPPDPSPWDESELARFNSEAQRMLALVREQLGSDFEIVDESGTAVAG